MDSSFKDQNLNHSINLLENKFLKQEIHESILLFNLLIKILFLILRIHFPLSGFSFWQIHDSSPHLCLSNAVPLNRSHLDVSKTKNLQKGKVTLKVGIRNSGSSQRV